MCPCCGCPDLTPLGILGKLEWFRCRACGMDINREVDEASLSAHEGEEASIRQGLMEFLEELFDDDEDGEEE